MDASLTISAPRPDPADLLARTAFSAIALGDWPAASRAVDECRMLADPARQPEVAARADAAAGIVATVRGDDFAGRELLDRSERAAITRGWTDLLDVVQLGRGIEALSCDRYDEAWARLRQLVDAAPRTAEWVRLLAISYLAEAGLHISREPAAGNVLATVEELAVLASTPALQGATAYARAITRPGTTVSATFDRALTECPADRAFDRARINLARGVCLRREGRVAESRLPLHEALVVFERLGASAWTEQARGQLRATGARRVHRELGDVESLTAQELQIVRMAADGLSNREIGRRLFLSHRTIGSHLYRAFPKLGVAARSQLRDALAEIEELDGALVRAAR